MDFSWSKFDLQGLPTVNISHRFVRKCTFPVQANSQKALKNTFQATTFKVEDNSRTFQGLAQKFEDFSRKNGIQGLFKDHIRLSRTFQDLGNPTLGTTLRVCFVGGKMCNIACLAAMLHKKLDTFVACFTIVLWEFFFSQMRVT